MGRSFGSHCKYFKSEWDGKPVEGFVKGVMWSVSCLVLLEHFYSGLSGGGDDGGVKQQQSLPERKFSGLDEMVSSGGDKKEILDVFWKHNLKKLTNRLAMWDETWEKELSQTSKLLDLGTWKEEAGIYWDMEVCEESSFGWRHQDREGQTEKDNE